MKTVMAIIALGLLLVGCSGKDSTGPGSNATFSLSTSRIELTGVETAVQPLTSQFTIANVSSDTIECHIRESSDWISTNIDRVKIAASANKPITISLDLSELVMGTHVDTITVIDFAGESSIASIVVQLVAAEDNTYGTIEQLISGGSYLGEFDGWHCYNAGSTWYVKCHSNSGNSIEVFAYEAYSSGKLADSYFDEIAVAPNDSLVGNIGFEGCTTVPPPLNAYWTIKVGYKVHGEVVWINHMN